MDKQLPTTNNDILLDDGMQKTPDHQVSRVLSRFSTAERSAQNPASKSQTTVSNTPPSRLKNAELPVVRLFSTTPKRSRMRRTSSPLRTTVTLDIQSPLAERSDANIASAEAQDPARGKRNLPQSELRRTGSPLRHLPQELVRKGNSTSLTRSPTGNTSTSSLPQPKPDKENQPTFAAPATVEVMLEEVFLSEKEYHRDLCIPICTYATMFAVFLCVDRGTTQLQHLEVCGKTQGAETGRRHKQRMQRGHTHLQ